MSGSPAGPCSTGCYGRSAGPASTAAGPAALVHGLRHTFATEPANANANVYTLMNLLGHESISTSQRYVTTAGRETRVGPARPP